MTNTLAYYGTDLIIAVKLRSFKQQTRLRKSWLCFQKILSFKKMTTAFSANDGASTFVQTTFPAGKIS